MAKTSTSFSKGKGGRKKGSKNKVGAPLREFLAGVLDDNKEKFQETLKGLSKGEFIKLYLETLQYTLPKLKQIEHREVPELEVLLLMTPEERAEKLKELQQLLKKP